MPASDHAAAVPQHRSHARLAWGGALFTAVVFVVFGRSIGFDFVDFDDPTHILADPYLRPFNTASLHRFWAAPYAKLYIPATYTLWGVISRFAVSPSGRFDPGVFHLANVAAHLLNVLLVALLLRKLFGPGVAAPLGALIFAVHPLAAEPVAWVSGMKDLSAGGWALLSLLLYLQVLDRTGRRAVGFYAAATACFVLAALSKPATVVLPVLAFVLGRLAKAPRGRQLLGLCPWAALAVPYVLVTRRSQARADVMAWNPPGFRPVVALDAVGFYVRKILWPSDLCVDYGRTPKFVADHLPETAAAAGLVAALFLAVALALRRQRPAHAAGGLILVVGVAPVMGFVPFLYQQFSTVSDRYLYLSMLGVAVIVAQLATDFGRWGVTVILAAAAALGVVCFEQVGTWRDTRTLFTHNLRVNPNSALSCDTLGRLDLQSGRADLAEPLFRRATALAPDEPVYATSLKDALVALHRPAEAEQAYAASLVAAARRVLRADPGSSMAHRALARAYQMQGKSMAAEDESAKAAASGGGH